MSALPGCFGAEMTEMWNKEQIEAAMSYAHSISNSDSTYSDLWDDFLQALTKPKPVFKVGEVLARKTAQGDTVYFAHEGAYMESHRHLNETEVPSLALAIERLERIASEEYLDVNGFADHSAEVDTTQRYAQTALDDIRAMI